MLQTLCLLAMNANQSRSSIQDTVDLLEKVHNSQPPQLSQVTDGKHTFKASEEEGEQPQKKETNDLNNSVDFPESLELSDQEIEREKWRVQEKEEMGGSLEQWKARKEQVLKDKVSRLRSIAEHLLTIFSAPDPFGDHVDEGNSDIQPKKEAENGHCPVHGSEVDLKGIIDDVDCNVSLPRPEEEHQGAARQLREEKQMIEERTGQITSLQTEEASLQCETLLLDSEIQPLKQKLQSLPDLHDDYVMQLHKKLFKEEARCLGWKKLFNVYRAMNSIIRASTSPRRQPKTWAKNWREPLPTITRRPASVRKKLKKAGWWRWRESSRSQGKRVTTTGRCWPRSSPTSSRSQGALVPLLLYPQSTEAQKCQEIPWVIRHHLPGRRKITPRGPRDLGSLAGLTQLTAAGSGHSQPGQNICMCFPFLE